MDKKILLGSSLIVVGCLAMFITKSGTVIALCPPNDSGCIVPTPGSTVSTSAPAPNSISTQPGYDPGTDNFSGNAQPFFDVGNDTEFSHTEAKIPIYMRVGDTISVTITNASPACLKQDGVTGLYYPDYSQNGYNSGPTTLFDFNGPNVPQSLLKGQTALPTLGCSDPIIFNGIKTEYAHKIQVNGSNVDSNGLSGSGYVYEIDLVATVSKYDLMKGENAFQISITNTSNNSELASGDDQTGYGYRQGDLSPSTAYTQEVIFGVDEDCSNYNQTKPGQIEFDDMDANNYQYQSTISVALQEEPWNNNDNFTNWKTVKTFSHSFLLNHENYSYGTNFDNSYRYRLLLINVGRKNTIFIKLSDGLSQISGQYHLGLNDCYDVSCTARANPADPATNQGTTITVQVKNAADSNDFPGSFELRQTAPVGTPQNVGGLQAGKSKTLTYNISARGSPKTIEFDYTLYSDTVANNGQVVGNDPLCSTTIQWSTKNVSISCQDVSVYGIKTTNVTYSGTTSKKYGPYYTTTRPSNYGQPGYNNNNSSTYQWSSTTPPTKAPSPYDQDPPPNKIGVVYWYFSGKTYTSSSTQTADKIPVQFIMTGNGVNQTVYEWVSVDGSGNNPPPFNTFTTFTDAWPHRAGYVVTLSYGSSGTIPSRDYYTNSPNNAQPAYNDTNHSDGGSSTLGTVCLQISNCSASISPGDVEPGQSTKYSFVYPVNNQTGDSFGPGNGRVYDFGVGANPGANVSPPTTVEPTIDTSGSVTVQYNGWLDYTGLYANDVVPNDGTGQVLASCHNTSTPYTKPYFQVWNSDASAGGGFASPSGSCAGSSDPPYISPANGSAGGPNAGGIRAFARSSVAGSSTDFGAIAMGQIPLATANGSQFVGFFNASGQNTYFANSGVSGLGSTSMGGYLNSTSTAHCVPDYFTQTRESANPTNWSGGNVSGLSSGQYTLTSSTISGGSIGGNYAGKQITVYVDGDVTITGNINYPGLFDPTTQSDIPYFTLIARGNIYLTNNVTHLDGLYIAQPKADGSKGVFATCDYSSDAQDPQGSQGPCNSQLVIDGAMIAQHVELLRNHSTLDPPDHGNQDGIGNNPAEVINYVPSMIIGSPAFQGNYGNIENVFSLPPVF